VFAQLFAVPPLPALLVGGTAISLREIPKDRVGEEEIMGGGKAPLARRRVILFAEDANIHSSEEGFPPRSLNHPPSAPAIDRPSIGARLVGQ